MSHEEDFPSPTVSIPELAKRDPVFKNIIAFARNEMPKHQIAADSPLLYDDSLIHFYWAMTNNEMDELDEGHDFEDTKRMASEMLKRGLIDAALEEKIKTNADRQAQIRANRGPIQP